MALSTGINKIISADDDLDNQESKTSIDDNEINAYYYYIMV